MRLLLDENISWRLTAYLQPHCAAVLHVRDISLDNSPDTTIWRYARQHGYDILTKDEDFLRLVLSEGFPPRVVTVQQAQVPVAKVGDVPASPATATARVSGAADGVWVVAVAAALIPLPLKKH